METLWIVARGLTAVLAVFFLSMIATEVVKAYRAWRTHRHAARECRETMRRQLDEMQRANVERLYQVHEAGWRHARRTLTHSGETGETMPIRMTPSSFLFPAANAEAMAAEWHRMTEAMQGGNMRPADVSGSGYARYNTGRLMPLNENESTWPQNWINGAAVPTAPIFPYVQRDNYWITLDDDASDDGQHQYDPCTGIDNHAAEPFSLMHPRMRYMPQPQTDEEFAAHHARMWSDVPQDIKDHARRIILEALPQNVLQQIRDAYRENPNAWSVGHHFTFGMGIRNLLRSGYTASTDTLLYGIPDAKLPSGNWDDYYVAALENAAGVRP